MDKSLPRWLEWAREIQALAQSGNAYAVLADPGLPAVFD
jgi:hypothetical protein